MQITTKSAIEPKTTAGKTSRCAWLICSVFNSVLFKVSLVWLIFWGFTLLLKSSFICDEFWKAEFGQVVELRSTVESWEVKTSVFWSETRCWAELLFLMSSVLKAETEEAVLRVVVLRSLVWVEMILLVFEVGELLTMINFSVGFWVKGSREEVVASDVVDTRFCNRNHQC